MNKTTAAALVVALLAGPLAHAQDTGPLPAGTWKLDPAHTSVVFEVSHLGFSNWTARFNKVDGELQLDPAAPADAKLTATIDPRSLDTGNQDPTYDFDAQVQGPEFLDAGQFPQITYHSTAVKLTSENTADVTGDLKLHGVTLPVTLQVRFNGGYPSHPMDPGGARIGFSATGSLSRSAFGIAFGVPAPGTTMGVGDLVSFAIETEFQKPAAP